MIKSARGKKTMKIIGTVFYILALCGIIHSIGQITVYSKCIDQPADVLLADCLNHNNYFLSSETESDEDSFSLHFSIMGGMVQVGELTVKNGSVIAGHVEKRTGRAKLLFVDDSTDKAAFYQEISNNTPISLPQGIYHVYFVGSWFSGKCSMDCSNATFQEK